MATQYNSAILMVALVVLLTATTALAKKKVVLKYYTQQQFGVNEFRAIQAAIPLVQGTFTGVGLEVVYNYTITKSGDPSSRLLGTIRGTSIVATNTIEATLFVVNTMVHYDDHKKGGLKGTFTTQGEANFGSGKPFELAVTGGTGDFRGVFGYTIARGFKFIPPTTHSTAKVTNYYVTRLWWN